VANALIDRLDALRLQPLEMVLYGLELLGRMPLPFRHLADNPERFVGALGERRIAGKFLARQIGIVLDRASRLDDVDPAAPVPGGQLGAPDRRIGLPVR
jgi:hypothetical protein